MKRVVVTWGRFNPPTIGHQKLIEKVASVAGRDDYFIFPTHTHKKPKDPLPSDKKAEYMRMMFPNHAKNIIHDRTLNIIPKMLIHIQELGYDEIVWVAGSDRVHDYQSKWAEQYNGVDYYFPKFEVVSAGQRDPDAEGASGMSASKMRAAAKEKNIQDFYSGIPDTLSKEQKLELMKEVRKGMGL